MFIFRKKKSKDSVYAEYPCSVYLNNALRFIQEGNSDAAYQEICYAIRKAGDNITVNTEDVK